MSLARNSLGMEPTLGGSPIATQQQQQKKEKGYAKGTKGVRRGERVECRDKRRRTTKLQGLPLAGRGSSRAQPTIEPLKFQSRGRYRILPNPCPLNLQPFPNNQLTELLQLSTVQPRTKNDIQKRCTSNSSCAAPLKSQRIRRRAESYTDPDGRLSRAWSHSWLLTYRELCLLYDWMPRRLGVGSIDH